MYIHTPVIDGIGITNENQIDRAIKMIQQFPNKKLGFLGLSFKQGTDDLRNSPAVRVIEAIIGQGENVTIYDKNVNLSILTGTNKDFIDTRIPHLSKLLVADLEGIISESDVLIVCTKEKEFEQKLIQTTHKTIIDFVRLSDDLLDKKNYFGINWGGSSPSQNSYVSSEDTVVKNEM